MFNKFTTQRFLISLTVFAVLLPPCPVNAQSPTPIYLEPDAPVSLPLIVLTADEPDHTYELSATAKPNEVAATATFFIQINVNPYPAEGINITYELGPEMNEGNAVQATVPLAGLRLPPYTAVKPGFVRCRVEATLPSLGLKTACATVGFSPEKIGINSVNLKPIKAAPTNFKPYWENVKGLAKGINPSESTRVPRGDLPQSSVSVYDISFKNVIGRIHGVLSVPKVTGRFPALLILPEAGVRSYTGNQELAQSLNAITLEIGIHGIPVHIRNSDGTENRIYDNLARGALANYSRFQLDNRENYYFKRVYSGCFGAINYLTKQTNWDGKNLIVMGTGQGGQLAIAMAALSEHVTGVAAGFPTYNDPTGAFSVSPNNTGLLYPYVDKTTGDLVNKKREVANLYDTTHFATLIKNKPGIYWQGYNNAESAVGSFFLTYNSIENNSSTPKTLYVNPKSDNVTTVRQKEFIRNWLSANIRRKNV
jgi:cephalosporin-C deacetylase-like acetyl esterase